MNELRLLFNLSSFIGIVVRLKKLNQCIKVNCNVTTFIIIIIFRFSRFLKMGKD